MRRIVVLILMLAVAAPAYADGPRRGRVSQADKAEKRRMKLKKKIRTMRAIVLAEELDLDEDTAAKLFPILNKYDDEFAKLAKEAIDLRKQAETASEADVDDIIDDLVANQRARWDLDQDRFKAVRKVLTAKQAAKILVVLPEIDRKILRGAKKALGGEKADKAEGKKGKKGKKAKKKAADADEIEDPFDSR